ncbi:MAG: metal ABC transporter solute-binding protein, Zn/Mn family [Planctomycetota bacterium]
MRSSRREFLKIAWLGASGVTLAGCLPNRDPKQETRSDNPDAIQVVATTGMVADMVRSIGGDAIRLTQLIPAGVDPHLYKPIRDDVVAIVHSEIVFYNGLKLEGRMADVLSSPAKSDRLHVALSDALDPKELIGEPGTDAVDPHIWMNIALWSKTLPRIQQALSKRLPKYQDRFLKAADILANQLAELDQYGKAAIERIPDRQRILISSHDAFQYFGRQYGLRVEGVQGISTASEAGLKRIPELIDLIGKNSVPAVFKESSVAGKMIDAVIEGAASRGLKLNVGPELYSDALGPAGSRADTYLGMMKHNFDAVAQALSATQHQP